MGAWQASRYVRWARTLPPSEHFYVVGNQHANEQRAYPASRATTLLLLASRPAEGSAALRARVEAAFRARPS